MEFVQLVSIQQALWFGCGLIVILIFIVSYIAGHIDDL